MNKITKSDFEAKNRIEHAIYNRLGITTQDMICRSRKREISYARDLYCFFMRKRTNFSHKAIGRFLGGRVHGAIIHSHDNIRELSAVYQHVKDDIRVIDEMIRPMGIRVG